MVEKIKKYAKTLKNKKIIILTFFAIIIITFFSSSLNLNKKINKAKAEIKEEVEPVSLEIEIKEKDEENYQCVLMFETKVEDEKIDKIILDNDFSIMGNNKKKIAVDYQFKNDYSKAKTFELYTNKGNKYDLNTTCNIRFFDVFGNLVEEKQILKGDTIEIKKVNVEEQYIFTGWSNLPEQEIPDYIYGDEIKFIKNADLYVSYLDKDSTKDRIKFENKSLIGKISKITEKGLHVLDVEDTTYNVNVANITSGTLILDGINEVPGATLNNNVYEFGDNTQDVANESRDAQNTVALIVDGNIYIKEGVTLTACKSENNYGGPKGLIIYCSGTIINEGSVSMTARGARAVGQNIYLWKNENDSYEYVPAIGASGGEGFTMVEWSSHGKSGYNGNNRKTGGGGSGSGRSYYRGAIVSAGGSGTSYSGGCGSGASNSDGGGGWWVASGEGSSTGGTGGAGVVGSRNGSGYGQISLGGTGNPSGSGSTYREEIVNYTDKHGTGGLLIIFSDFIISPGYITANGVESNNSGLTNGYGRCDTGGASRRRKY